MMHINRKTYKHKLKNSFKILKDFNEQELVYQYS